MRTSYSCASCAKRKRKCDLEKPVCSRCQKLKIECIYPSKNRFMQEVMNLQSTLQIEDILSWPQSNEFTYTNLFFQSFCTNRSILLKRELWRPIIATHSQYDEGVHNAILAVSSMHAYKTLGRDSGEESVEYYKQSVRCVQDSLSCITDATVIGITLLMVFEMQIGNVIGLQAHTQALVSIVQQAGPERCLTGLYCILFLTVLTPILVQSLSRGCDLFLADKEWLDLINIIQPPSIAKKTCLYIRAARAISQLPREVPVLLGPRQDLMLIAKQIRNLYNMMQPAIAPFVESPFQPSLQLEDEFRTSGFPFMIAMLIHIEEDDTDRYFLTCQIVQFAQTIVMSSNSSAALLHQVWPLEIAKQQVLSDSELAWIGYLEHMIQMKGFGIAGISRDY